MGMNAGKLSQTIWRRSVEKQLKKEKDSRLTVPAVTENCMAVQTEAEGVELTTTAAIAGNAENSCFYAMAKAVNDLAARGGRLQGISAQIWFPLRAKERDVKKSVACLQTICKEREIPILGIQAEVNPAVNQMFVQITAMGRAEADDLGHIEKIKAGEEILLCGTIGLEGILRILDEKEEVLRQRFIPTFLHKIKSLKDELFLEEAALTAKAYANKQGKYDTFAMQQIGSGGIFAALWEMAEAAGVGLEIDLSQIAIHQETVEICEYYQLNPYQMTSTGALLLVTEDGAGLMKVLEKAGVRATRLGVITAEHARVITSGGEQRYMDRPAPDEFMRWCVQELERGKKYEN